MTRTMTPDPSPEAARGRLVHWHLGALLVEELFGRFGTEWRQGDPESRLHAGSRAGWVEWLAEEESVRPGSLSWIRRTWLKDPSIEPVSVTREGGVISVWDGHHRIAAAIEAGLREVPAFIGTPRDRLATTDRGLALVAPPRRQLRRTQMDKLESLAFYVRANRHAKNASTILASADAHLYPRARKLAAERLIAARAARRLALEEHVATVRAELDWGFARTDLRGAL